MKVTPIIMSAPMVRALLEGRKTQTRRIVKPQTLFEGKDAIIARFPNQRGCPYGESGESFLWVRETWARHYTSMEGMPVHYRADLPVDPSDAMTANHAFGLMKWKPSIHMPRRASRLTLELTGVRVERLQDITEDDAIAEGIEPVLTGANEHCGWLDYQHVGEGVGYFPNPIDSYHSLFRLLHGDDVVGKNPWLWVLHFSTHQVNIDTFLKTREAAA